MIPRILITGFDDAEEILTNTDLAARVTHIVSIGEPEVAPPRGYDQHPGQKLRLELADIAHDDGVAPAPRREHVAALIEFAHRIDGDDPTVLVHCRAGISRSTAAALILYCARTRPGGEAHAVKWLLSRAPYAWPNALLVSLGDELLERRGALVDAVKAIPFPFPSPEPR